MKFFHTYRKNSIVGLLFLLLLFISCKGGETKLDIKDISAEADGSIVELNLPRSNLIPGAEADLANRMDIEAELQEFNKEQLLEEEENSKPNESPVSSDGPHVIIVGDLIEGIDAGQGFVLPLGIPLDKIAPGADPVRFLPPAFRDLALEPGASLAAGNSED